VDQYSVTRLRVERIDDVVALIDAGLGTFEKNRVALETLTTSCVTQLLGCDCRDTMATNRGVLKSVTS
jgi:hypothetical protein